jgi:hypothetical protein
MIVTIFIIYLTLQVIFNVFGKGHYSEYTISIDDKVFEIKEKYVANTKDERNNYYFEITHNDIEYNIQVFDDFYGAERIIKKGFYYEDGAYKCFLPIFYNDLILVDLICLKDNVQYPYNFIKGENKNIDTYVESLNNTVYKVDQFLDDKQDIKVDSTMTAYVNNVIDGHYVGINNYRGIYTISDDNLQTMYNARLFKTDTYKRPVSAIIDKYYITADYDQRYAFDKFHIVDLTNNKTFELYVNGKIEHDSYIQGIINNTMYLFDRYNKKQYEIRINPFAIVEVGNENNNIKYYNLGEWSRVPVADALNNTLLFNLYEQEEKEGYVRVDKVGNELSGYYYFYKKVNNIHQVYRAPVQNKEKLTHILDITKMSDVVYIDDYLYFNDGPDVKYYHDKYGVKTLFNNSELEFNNALYFNVYKK